MPFNDYWSVPLNAPDFNFTPYILAAGGVLVATGLVAWAIHMPWYLIVGLPALGIAIILFLLYRKIMTVAQIPFPKSPPPAPASDLPTVLKALYLQRGFTDLAIRAQGMDDQKLYKEFGDFIAEAQANRDRWPDTETRRDRNMTGMRKTMMRGLDLADIQGNIVYPYGRFGFPKARHLFFNIGNAPAGRYFIEQVRHDITTSERWASDKGANSNAPARPLVAVNIGLSFWGLLALDLPTRMLRQLPDEFIDGMAKRSGILGDVGSSAPEKWDPIWVNAAAKRECQVHIWVSLNAMAKPDGTPIDALAERTDWLQKVAAASGGVTLLTGHRGSNAAYQDSSALMQDLGPTKVPTPKEHFGFTDGIADPVFAGQYEPDVESKAVIGSGKFLPDNKGWAPLATGEFILGHDSEAQELPPSAPPWSFMRNGTFMAYRKLYQNVASFRAYVAQQASLYQQVTKTEFAEAAEMTIRAKMVGRWPNGFPLAIAPTYEESEKLAATWAHIPAIQLKRAAARTKEEAAELARYEQLLVDFRYGDDIEGAKCPVSAHIRRSNPRDALDPRLGSAPPAPVPDSSLSNRRRILRRGLPYGELDKTG